MTKLNHPKFGSCELVRTDRKTYSIPMAIVKLEDGSEICRPLAEFVEASNKSLLYT